MSYLSNEELERWYIRYKTEAEPHGPAMEPNYITFLFEENLATTRRIEEQDRRHDELMTELKAIRENSDRTVMDLKSVSDELAQANRENSRLRADKAKDAVLIKELKMKLRHINLSTTS